MLCLKEVLFLSFSCVTFGSHDVSVVEAEGIHVVMKLFLSTEVVVI